MLFADEQISKAELRLTDIAESLYGDWVRLARQLSITESEVAKIRSDYTYVGEQALVMLHLWVQKSGNRASGNDLQRALQRICRDDVVQKCMYNIVPVTDVVEKAVARVFLDGGQYNYLAFKLVFFRLELVHFIRNLIHYKLTYLFSF